VKNAENAQYAALPLLRKDIHPSLDLIHTAEAMMNIS
jgi:hypothetical protein